jgi:hypothetical protein
MKSYQSLPLLLMTHAEASKCIYTRSDLTHLLGTSQSATIAKRIEALLKKGYLHRAMNGYFFTKGARIEDLAQRIFTDGYLSLHGILNHHGMCGTKKSNHVDIITARSRPKTIKTPIGTIHMHVQNKAQQFGYEFHHGFNMATPEKCFVDTCYFHQKCPSHQINLYSDLIISNLSISKINEILIPYKNKKFITFVLSLAESYGHKIRNGAT